MMSGPEKKNLDRSLGSKWLKALGGKRERDEPLFNNLKRYFKITTKPFELSTVSCDSVNKNQSFHSGSLTNNFI